MKVKEDDILYGYITTCQKAGCPLSNYQEKLLAQVFFENKARNLDRNFKFQGLSDVAIDLSKAALDGNNKDELLEIAKKNK